MADFNINRQPPIDVATFDKVVNALSKAEKYFENARKSAEEQITLPPPWDYDPDDYTIDDDTAYIAIKWCYESRERLEASDDNELKKLAQRMEDTEKALVEEADDPEIENLYKSIHLLISTQDGLISWLCKHDESIDSGYTNDGGEEIYFSDSKKTAIERWYSEYAKFGIEDNDGISFREKWENFWEHRHRVMHGHPNAFYDENLAISALFFLSLTAHVVMDRSEDVSEIQSPP